MPSPLSENLAAARARFQAARTPGGSSLPGGSVSRSGFLTPRVATPGTLLEHGLEGLGEFSFLLSGGGDAATSVFVMTETLRSELCCGWLKGGSRFCTMGKSACPVKSHHKKASVLVEHLYVAGAKNSAYASTSLAVSKISAEQMRRFLSEQHSVQEWTKIFFVLSGYEESLEAKETEAVVRQVVGDVESTAVGKTPKRRRFNFTDSVLGAALSEEGRKPFALTPLGSLAAEDDQLSRVLAQWDRLVGQVSNLTQSDEKTKQVLCSELDEFGIQLRALEASIGRDTAADPSATVWGGLVEVREDVAEHEDHIVALSDELAVVQEDVGLMQDSKRSAELEASELRIAQEELSELTAFISTEQEALIKDVVALQKAISEGAASRVSSSPAMGASAAWRRESEVLRNRVASAESEIGVRMQALEVAVGRRLEDVSLRIDTLTAAQPAERMAGGLEDEMKMMREKLKILEARVSSKPVIIGGKVFASFPDVHKFVVDCVPPNIYFLFHDPVTLLESISDAYTSKSDVMLEMHQGQKVGFSNEAEATIVASFKVLLPTVFSRSKDGAVPAATGSHHLPAVRSYQAWNPHDGVTGVKQYIEKGLDDLRRTLGNDIDSYFVDNPEARMLALELLSLSCGFISEMCNWIDTFFHELVNLSGVTKEEAWQLIAACIKKFFEDFRTVRSPAANASSDKDVSSKCAKYLWAVLQVHDLMKEYREKRFRGHPSIAPVVNFHVFQTRVTKVAFDELSAKMVALAAKFSGFDSLQGRVAKLEKK